MSIVKVDLQLTPEEQEELSIQWHVSNILYFEKKQEAIKQFKEFGFDLEKREITVPASYPNMIGVVLSALRYKSECDLAVVSIAAPINLRRYINIIVGRTTNEYDYYYRLFWCAIFNPTYLTTSELRLVPIRGTPGDDLEELRKGFSELKSAIPNMQTKSEIYIRAREMVRSNG